MRKKEKNERKKKEKSTKVNTGNEISRLLLTKTKIIFSLVLSTKRKKIQSWCSKEETGKERFPYKIRRMDGISRAAAAAAAACRIIRPTK